MMKIREIATNVKVLIGAGVAIVGVLVTLGMQIDRPAWSSELIPLKQMAGANQKMLLQIQIDQLTRSIWLQEDRLKISPNQDGVQRLRELNEQRDRLNKKMKHLLEKDDG